MNTCKLCKKTFVGRRDKIFCTIACKNEYHYRLRSVNQDATTQIDNILHRNRSILLEIMGKTVPKKKILRLVLDSKNFNFDYITGFHINSKNKTVHHVYDFSWISFSDQEVLIYRRRPSK
jgi:hypothetical protein